MKAADLFLWQQIPHSDIILTVTTARFKYLVPTYCVSDYYNAPEHT